ncbi:MAG: hypothetical protein ACT4QA_23845 [Panacagrimonas sp.]
MKRIFLGDSYDAVKRLWVGVMADWAPLYAEPAFIPPELRHDFTKMTLVPVLGTEPPAAYSILNDPDTGIYAPGRGSQTVGRSHTSLEAIRAQLSDPAVKCVVTFDQSNHRKAGWSAQNQRREKVVWLADKGIVAFYYESHAPFMFASATQQDAKRVLNQLECAGIPQCRIESYK